MDFAITGKKINSPQPASKVTQKKTVYSKPLQPKSTPIKSKTANGPPKKVETQKNKVEKQIPKNEKKEEVK